MALAVIDKAIQYMVVEESLKIRLSQECMLE